MVSLKSLSLAIAFSICIALPLGAQPKISTASAKNPGAVSAHIHHIEASAVDMPMGQNEPPLRLDLQKLMQLYKVPGLSIAVVDNFQIVWAKAYGFIEAGSTVPVTPQTLFQAGSISKPVAATGALYLVQQGKLSLDEDVNQKLKTWKVPENEFTQDKKVTLRRLMSYTAGLTVHGFPGYDVNDPVPTLVQIFNGEKPANTAPIRVDYVPGTQARYSGGGVTIEQQLMMDVTGKPFPALMREIVLDRIGMTASSYEQPLPEGQAAMTASGTYLDGKVVHGRWHLYPEMAAAGLWTTPTDLSKFAIEIALSKHGKSNRVLSQEMTREMLTQCFGRGWARVLFGYGQSRAVWPQRSRRRLSGAAHHECRVRQGRSDHGELRQWDRCRRLPATECGEGVRLELQISGAGRLPNAGADRKGQRYASRAAAVHGIQEIRIFQD